MTTTTTPTSPFDGEDLPICETCGQQYNHTNTSSPPSPSSSSSPPSSPPTHCKICADDRQWEPPHTKWTSLKALATSKEGYKNEITELERNIYQIHTQPKVGIGQRCVLIQQREEEKGEEEGGESNTHTNTNILWDCCAFLDTHTITALQALGGISKIVISHPHFLGSCLSWSKAFNNAPIYLHASDQHWVTRTDAHTHTDTHTNPYIFWEGDELSLSLSLRIIRLGGHFPSSSVLLLSGSSTHPHTHTPTQTHTHDGKSVLFTGDTILPVPHRRWCSFMYSFPNLLPLPAFVVEEMKRKIEGIEEGFDRLYGPFPSSCICGEARAAVLESAGRYLESLAGKYHGK